MNESVSKGMLEERLHSLLNRLFLAGQEYDTVILTVKVNQYYYTGTMQDGLLVLRKSGELFYFVRKSYDRACLESPLTNILPIRSYRDMIEYLPQNLGVVYMETEKVPIAMLDRIRKYFQMDRILSVDRLILEERAVKSEYELEMLKESGRLHEKILFKSVPDLLREGICETDFTADLYASMVKAGHHGVSRFSMFQVEMVVGQLGFGETSTYPTYFDGPGGMQGLCAAVPLLGRRDVFLKKGDIVFVDVGFGHLGYHTDKTQVFSFGQEPSEQVIFAHRACIDVMNKASEILLPGRTPAEIYRTATQVMPESLRENFMGQGKDRVRFLGHGVGLEIDELPVIADNKSGPLVENMVIALEPKCSLPGIGMVGVEETFLVTDKGAVCLTGGPKDIMTLPFKS